MVAFPNSSRLSAETLSFINFYYGVLDNSRSLTSEEPLRGVRTIQITELLQTASLFAAAVPEPDTAVGRPELPSIPTSWTSEHVQLAVRYLYGVNASVSDTDADAVIARMVEQYNQDNVPITWSIVEILLDEMITNGDINVEIAEL